MVEDITPEELYDRLRDGDAVQIVDIRPEAAFRRGYIPGAENVPFHRFAAEAATREWGTDIVVACPHGESSRQAARLLESYEGVPDGARVANLEGGYAAWEYELDRDD